MKKVATIIYAVGWTQHSFGTQIIRTAAILQLLLGNIGRAGGGVNALRGHSNIQGATDMAGVFDILARLPEDAEPHRRRSRHLSQAHHAGTSQTRSVGFVQLLVEHSQVRRLLPESDVWPRGDQRKRLGLPPPAEDRPQLFVGESSGTTCTKARSKEYSPSA